MMPIGIRNFEDWSKLGCPGPLGPVLPKFFALIFALACKAWRWGVNTPSKTRQMLAMLRIATGLVWGGNAAGYGVVPRLRRRWVVRLDLTAHPIMTQSSRSSRYGVQSLIRGLESRTQKNRPEIPGFSVRDAFWIFGFWPWTSPGRSSGFSGVRPEKEGQNIECV